MAPNMPLGELPGGELNDRCQGDQDANLSRTRIATSSKYPVLQDAQDAQDAHFLGAIDTTVSLDRNCTAHLTDTPKL